MRFRARWSCMAGTAWRERYLSSALTPAAIFVRVEASSRLRGYAGHPGEQLATKLAIVLRSGATRDSGHCCRQWVGYTVPQLNVSKVPVTGCPSKLTSKEPRTAPPQARSKATMVMVPLVAAASEL